MNFRESINNLIRGDKPESTSRAIALVFALSTVGWIWYALITQQLNPLLAILVQVLSFILILLGLKGSNEVKMAAVTKGATDAAGTDQTGS